ncbi:hypothetical protein Bcop_0259 [Bacteroides coprosuis DSM 18011]|uniref:Cell division protein FtsL n=1 Tax=Bacteroides coprosuis DSM 18011 TaxID=679937 RepID=F3ZQ36_9BACE|nr:MULTISPECIES: FtsL-like putative cell division protein [Bacteroides]EGJ70478.1 hypothetical protein Bcop_0259 [Bacteroides coprosuis DSM 18011]HJD93336.1 hypothetical protein [Bacteroides coprosuis]
MKDPNLNTNTNEEPKSAKKKLGFIRILRGDILVQEIILKNIPFIVLLVVIAIFYVSNRYQYQQLLIEKNKLEVTLKDSKFRALTRTADLMDKSRQSKIEEHITRKGSELEIPTNPPYIIKK